MPLIKPMITYAAADNNGRMFKLIQSTGGRRNNVSETIPEPDGTLIVNRNRRLVD